MFIPSISFLLGGGPATHEFYETIVEERDSNAYAVAFTDFFVEPSIKPLDLSQYKGQVGNPILIRAVDDIGPAGMEVTLTANDGTQIEKGKAVEAGVRTGLWTYTATAPVTLGSDIFIKVVSVDHAGTKAQITENPIVGADLSVTQPLLSQRDKTVLLRPWANSKVS